MTHHQFMTAIEEWYGDYSGDMKRNAVLSWLIQNVHEQNLESLFKRVTTEYSDQYKTPPTHFQFNQIVNGERIEVLAERSLEKLLGMSSMMSYVFEDLVTQQVIESMGGVDEFVNRMAGPEAVWTRKEFIEKYVRECRYPREIVRKVIYGRIDQAHRSAGDLEYVGMYGYGYIGSPEKKDETMKSISQAEDTIKSLAVVMTSGAGGGMV